jgi:L-lactate dehydrogenase complex protein LldG
MKGAREQILARVRGHSGETEAVAYEEIARSYQRSGVLAPTQALTLLTHRLKEYDANVVESTQAEVAGTIAGQLAANNRRQLAAPAGLPAHWMASEFSWRVDHGLAHAEIEECDGVVTAAFCAIADSGTIVLHHSPEEGRRVLSLLPDWHLCVLKASQVVECLPEYFARCIKPPQLATYISGPSATADIEMTRIKGVHGPRFLHVVLVTDS